MCSIKVFGLAVLLVILQSCKIIQEVPDEGYVASRSGSFDCPEGQNCLIDVENGADFAASFVAVPFPGYRFVQWKDSIPREYASLCSGDTKPCVLALPGAFTAFDVDGYLSPVFEIDSDYVAGIYHGTEYGDILVQDTLGLPDWSSIIGGDGDDVITLSIGTAEGGPGNDTIVGTSRFSAVDYTSSKASIVANLETGVVSHGVGGTDVLKDIYIIHASSYDDTIEGSAGDDKIWMSSGENTVDGKGSTCWDRRCRVLWRRFRQYHHFCAGFNRAFRVVQFCRYA